MWKGNIWGRGNMGNMMNNPGELNKADIEYAVRKFLMTHDYVNTEEYKRIKGVMTTFMEYVEEL
jgi:4-hydroxy-3-methylbut-2-en-1-yl diphosphate synthase IspG/GcpE